MIFTFKLTHFIPQTMTSTLFRNPRLSVSLLEKFDLRADYLADYLPRFLKGRGLTLPKIPRKGGMEKLLKGRGDSVGNRACY